MCFNNFIIKLNGTHFTDFFHVGSLFPSQPSFHKQFYNVLSTGETQVLLMLHIIKHLYKFSMKPQHCIAFISLHSNQLVIHPGSELLKLQQAQFLLTCFYKES